MDFTIGGICSVYRSFPISEQLDKLWEGGVSMCTRPDGTAHNSKFHNMDSILLPVTESAITFHGQFIWSHALPSQAVVTVSKPQIQSVDRLLSTVTQDSKNTSASWECHIMSMFQVNGGVCHSCSGHIIRNPSILGGVIWRHHHLQSHYVPKTIFFARFRTLS